MNVLVLGSAAGGGSPQWNCNCSVCRAVRAGAPGTEPRTQTSLAVTADGERWLLVNASPDLRQQINDSPDLHPRRGQRHSPVASVIVTNGDVDHVTGLLTLREGQPFSLYAGAPVLRTLEGNSVFDVLDRSIVPRRKLALDAPTEITDASGNGIGLTVTAFAVPGKVALYDETDDAVERIGEETAGTLGLHVHETGAPDGGGLFVVTACACVTDSLRTRLDGADVLFFDGTLWDDDELVRSGLTEKTGRRMGHVSMNGSDGSIAQLAGVEVGQRIFIHVNNSNPVLLATSDERRAVLDAGWTVAHDGLRLTAPTPTPTPDPKPT